MNRRRLFLARATSGILLAFAVRASGVERFGDISVAPESVVSGNTHHGYLELRISLVNESLKETHKVTLIFPDRAYGYGNSISRISRTVSLGPASRVVVPLWLPPLPANGNGQLRVVIDGEAPHMVTPPGVTQHQIQSGPGYSEIVSTILVSRSLNYDELGRVLKSEQGKLSASMAVGPPDAGGGRGVRPTAWMPDASAAGPHWLELEYHQPIRADRARIFETMRFPPGGEMVLTGISGTNILRVPLSPPVSRTPRPPAFQEFAFAPMSEPVKTVRLNFGSAYAGVISIDAVELADTSTGGSAWASSARASSEAAPGGSSASGSSGSETRELLRSEFPVSEWSEYWLSYTPYDAIALDATDLKTMSPAVLNALWCYAECGGNIFIFGGGEIPDTWRSFHATALEGGQSFSAGFGQCFVFESDQPASLKVSSAKTIGDAVDTLARAWRSLPDEGSANASFPVIENVRIPVRGIVFIMLAFVILIGPVNLIVLSRMKRRTWLLWTVPAISFVTSLLVFVYSLFREGIAPDVRIEGLTFLDQSSRRAASMGTTAFYCPLTPSQGLFFGSETEATPLVEAGDYRSGSRREVDWTESQHLERGWVAARVPAHFQLRKSETRRERLQLENKNGQMTVVNGLGASIRSLWLADASGRIYSAANVVAGQKGNLTASTEHPKITGQLGVRALFEKTGYARFESFPFAEAPAYLLPGTYLADLETNPFFENGLGPKAGSARTRSRAIVYGVLEPTSPP